MEEEWGLVAQLPSHSVYRTQAASPASREASEYYFYSEGAQRRFQASKAQIHTLSHPHILQTYEISGAHSESQLHFYTLQTDPCLLTLDTEMENRERTDGGWTQEEVLGVLQQLASALAFAATKGWYCSDLSGDNVAYGETGVKVRRLHTKDGIWYPDLRPQYLSPEMRVAYVNWTKGNKPGNVDIEKAAVYGLGLLVVSMLCGGFGGKVWRHEEVVRSCGDSQVQGKLKLVLAKMSVEKPEARISLAALCDLLSSDPEEISKRLLTSLNDATKSAEFVSAAESLSQIIERNLRFTTEVQCSACSELIHYSPGNSGTHFRCSKHILCAKHLPAATCPLCPARSLKVRQKPVAEQQRSPICPVCHTAFQPPEPGDWRSALSNPLRYSKSLSVCSEVCLERSNSTSAMLAKLVTVWNRKSRVLEKYFANVDEEARADYFHTQEAINQRKSILMYNEAWVCHFCHRELEDITAGRWIVCGIMPRFVCSTQCIERGIERGNTCPACSFSVTADSIQSALQTNVSQDCINCKSTDAEAQDCGHYSCLRCVSTFGGCAQCIADEYSITQDVADMADRVESQYGFSAYR